VVFFHYGQSVFPANIPFLFENVTAGPIAVGYFYVLSGFIMAIAYYKPDKNNQKAISKKKYWLARFARIYPVYLLALLLIVGAKYKDLAQNWEALPLHLLLLQSWIPPFYFGYNYPSWYLSIEFYIAIVFIFTFLMSKRYRNVLWLILSVTFVSIRFIDPAYYSGIIRGLACFPFGGVLYLIYNKFQEKINSEKLFTILEVISIIWVVYLMNVNIAQRDALIILGFGMMILIFAFDKGKISSLLNNKPLAFFGKLSFSIYLMQTIILFGLKIFIKILSKLDSNVVIEMLNDDEIFDLGSVLFNNLIIFLTLGVLVFISYYTNKYIEKKGIECGFKYINKKK